MVSKGKCWLVWKVVKTDSILDPVSSLSLKFELNFWVALAQINSTQTLMGEWGVSHESMAWMRRSIPLHMLSDVIFPQESINMRCFSDCKGCGSDVGVHIPAFLTAVHISHFQIKSFAKDMGLVPGHSIKRVIHQGNKEGNRCCTEERSHTYSTWLLWKCVYWSGCLTSSVPPGSVCRLCFAVRAIKARPRSLCSASFFFPVANQTPTGLTKGPSKAPASPPSCSGP